MLNMIVREPFSSGSIQRAESFRKKGDQVRETSATRISVLTDEVVSVKQVVHFDKKVVTISKLPTVGMLVRE